MMVKRFDVPLRTSSESIRKIAAQADAEFTLIYTRETKLDWVKWGLERMVQIARDSGAAMAYVSLRRSAQTG